MSPELQPHVMPVFGAIPRAADFVWNGLASGLIQSEGYADVDTDLALRPPARVRRSGLAASAMQNRLRACRARHADL